MNNTDTTKTPQDDYSSLQEEAEQAYVPTHEEEKVISETTRYIEQLHQA